MPDVPGSTVRIEQRRRAAMLARWSMGLGIAVACVGCMVLAGWALRVPWLRTVLPGYATMKPDTAGGFVLIGLALAMLARPMGKPAWMTASARLAAGLVAAFMAATLLEYTFGKDLGINTLILRALGRGEEILTGRGAGGNRWAPLMAPSPATITGLMLAALSVLLVDGAGRARVRPSEMLAACAGMIGLVATLGYAFGVAELYQFGLFFSTALHTAVCLVAIGAGVLLARAEWGAMSVLTSPLEGGRLARGLVPLTGIAPLALAWGVLAGHHQGWYGPSMAVALLGVSSAVVLAAAVLMTAWSLNRSDAARRKVEARQSMMMAELDHRVKNNLAAVLSLAELTIGSSGSLEAFGSTFTGRVRAMARTHEALAATRWEGVRLRELVRMTVSPLADGGKRLETEGEDVMLPSRASSAICVMLHELATNAAKYGAFSKPEGRVHVAWSMDATKHLTLEWRETGVDSIQEPTRRGFGTELIHGSVGHELQGTVIIEYRPPGLRCRITAPLSQVEHGSAEEAQAREVR
jgi:two-component sensor histidine kinase